MKHEENTSLLRLCILNVQIYFIFFALDGGAMFSSLRRFTGRSFFVASVDTGPSFRFIFSFISMAVLLSEISISIGN